MHRALLLLGVALVALAVLAASVGSLAYGADAARDGEREVDGLEAPVRLAWADGAVQIAAANAADLAAGLGYAHAADHAWTMMLWRQAAYGGLGEWFGARQRPLDRHARTLGFSDLAQETYRALDTPTRALLDGYARGVNAALAQPGVAQGDAFVQADVVPDAWQPWDALAVECLIAYLATPAPDSTWAGLTNGDGGVTAFVRADSVFRAALGIGGTEGARTFVAPTASGPVWVAHQPTGASSLPLFAPAVVRTESGAVSALTIPGTLSAPVGQSAAGGWSVFLTSALRLVPHTGPSPPSVFSRLTERDGDEILIEVPRDSTGLVLSTSAVRDTAASDPLLAEAPARDSLATNGWRMVWSGFKTGTDLKAFAELLQGRAPTAPFHLLRGDGLWIRDSTATRLGTPPVAVTSGGVTLAGAAPQAAAAAAALASLAPRLDSLPAAALVRSEASLRAAQTLRPLLRVLGDRDSLDSVLEIPYAYLNGWDHRYAPDAIAPSIYEAWLAAHRAYTGHAPDATDSLDVLLLPYTLRIARASLRDRHGPDLLDWRWGYVQSGFVRPFGIPVNDLFDRRASPSAQGTGGHPSSLFPGSDPTLATAGSGPATWSAWARLGHPGLIVQPPSMRLPERAHSASTAPHPVRLDRESFSPTLTLLPSS